MVRVSSSETPGVREVETRKMRSADAATYSSFDRCVSRQHGQGRSLPVSAICFRLLTASPTRATGGTPSWDASERFVRTILHARPGIAKYPLIAPMTSTHRRMDRLNRANRLQL